MADQEKTLEAKQLHWSIHRDTPKLDRAGVATSEKFWVLTHSHLTAMLNFELLHNNVLQAVGRLWSRKVSIPMGGPFSAQSADLHTLWGVKKNGKKDEGLGQHEPVRGRLHLLDQGHDVV